MKSPKLLVLTASTGFGHTSAARAIVEEAIGRGLEAKAVDVLEYTSPAFAAWYRGGYEMLVRRRPKLWGYLYKTSDRPLMNYLVQTSLDWWNCRHLRDLIEEYQPDWIVCTHSLPQPRLRTLQKRLGGGFKTSVVVTDLYVHRMWLRGKPNLYFVPQDYSRQVLQTRRKKLAVGSKVTGIPIHPSFLENQASAQARSELGLSNEFTIVLSAGGIGGGPVMEVAQSLAKTGRQVCVVAGRNDALLPGLQKIASDHEKMRVYGALPPEEMSKLMRAAHVMVGKPGGLTTFECLALGLPFLVYWPLLIPGQEEGNAQFLQEVGAGLICRDLESMIQAVERLSQDSQALAEMRERALAHAYPIAAQAIVDELVAQSSAGTK